MRQQNESGGATETRVDVDLVVGVAVQGLPLAVGAQVVTGNSYV
jgi:orotate phosphoribosyltransferase-like protein